jgi:hypothetical protein
MSIKMKKSFININWILKTLNYKTIFKRKYSLNYIFNILMNLNLTNNDNGKLLRVLTLIDQDYVLLPHHLLVFN